MTKTDKFTPEEIKKIHTWMQRTWGTIAEDIFTAVEGFDDPKKEKTMKRAEVIEVVLDADYMKSYGGINTPEDKELYKRFDKLDYDECKEIAMGTFTYKIYGR